MKFTLKRSRKKKKRNARHKPNWSCFRLHSPQVPCVRFAVQFAICRSTKKVYPSARLRYDREKPCQSWRCRYVVQKSYVGQHGLIHYSLEHQPRGHKRITQELTTLSVSHVDPSTQPKDTSECHYPRSRTATSGRTADQPNTASSGIRSSHRNP